MEELLKKIAESNLNCFGVRGDNAAVVIGQELDASFDWDYENDDYSENKLDGTCAVEINITSGDVKFEKEYAIEEIEKAITFFKKNYSYKNISIIGGNTASDGADENETIIENAVVIALV